MEKIHIVKRKGHKEKFDERKLYASVYAACYVAHENEKECEKTADAVTRDVKKWIRKKNLVDSDEIMKFVGRKLKKHNTHAAFLYETHMDVS